MILHIQSRKCHYIWNISQSVADINYLKMNNITQGLNKRNLKRSQFITIIALNLTQTDCSGPPTLNTEFWLFPFLFTMDYKYEFLWLLPRSVKNATVPREEGLFLQEQEDGAASLSEMTLNFTGLTMLLRNLKIMSFKNTKIQYSTSQQLFF